MPKIVIIGAGSGFGGRLSLDILSRAPLRESTICLCDIDPVKLRLTTRFVRRLIEKHRLPAKVVANVDRTKLLPGADFVVTSVSVGGPAYYCRPYADEIHIPQKYGIDQAVGDTLGPGGIFRFLRTGPVQLAFCKDIERLCPNALLLNYTNPMAMLTWLHSAGSSVRNVGLCHSVQGSTWELAHYIGVPYEEVTYWVAGINHQSWVLEFKHKGKDAYPLIRKAMENPEIYKKDVIRFEILKHFGFFVTESSPHNSEYLPYFRKNPELMAHFGLGSRKVSLEPPQPRKWLGKNEPVPDLVASHEYASGIMEAVVTNIPFRFNGNVINHGLITNLPEGCCVEVPCMVDRHGVNPCHVGNLPPQCAAINRSNIAVQELAVQAVLNRDREAAFHALALDPLTSAVLPLHKIREMFEEMWAAERHLLKYFERKR